MESGDGALPVALAPSAVPNERFHSCRSRWHRTSAGDHRRLRRGARYAADRGPRRVEIVASHGYLPAQFLNPNLNVRETATLRRDPRNRMRMLRETCPGRAPGSLPDFGWAYAFRPTRTYDATLRARPSRCASARRGRLRRLPERHRGTSASTAGPRTSCHPCTTRRCTPHRPPRRSKSRCRFRFWSAGRINQPHEAEIVLASGQADACAMTRALICDPEMPDKAQSQRTEEIRAYIA